MRKKRPSYNPKNKEIFLSVLEDTMRSPELASVKSTDLVAPIREYAVNFIEAETKKRGLQSGTAVFNSKQALIRKLKKAQVVDEVLYAISDALFKAGGTEIC